MDIHLEKKLQERLPRFYFLGIFSVFSGLRAISSELLKVMQIDFRESEIWIARELSKGGIFTRCHLFRELSLGEKPRLVVLGAFWPFYNFFGGVKGGKSTL